MAVTRREQQMLDLYDAGLNPAEIAAEMGVTEGVVRQRLNFLNSGLGLDRAGMAAIAHGSVLLREAVVALGGHR